MAEEKIIKIQNKEYDLSKLNRTVITEIQMEIRRKLLTYNR